MPRTVMSRIYDLSADVVQPSDDSSDEVLYVLRVPPRPDARIDEFGRERGGKCAPQDAGTRQVRSERLKSFKVLIVIGCGSGLVAILDEQGRRGTEEPTRVVKCCELSRR
jgi:hypothetical protein